MTCYHPLKAFELGVKANGKKDLKVASFSVDHFERRTSGVLVPSMEIERSPYADKVYRDYLRIPCGQCLGCRIDYSRDWATRMMLEYDYHETSSFITLTYNDLYVPLCDYVDKNGEEQKSMTLLKRDMQLFMKRLRKKYPDKQIRFYGCGEYGPKNQRPHYHLIIFGLDFAEDRYVHQISALGDAYYRSPTLEKLWPYGYSYVCDVSWQTCAYVARYVTKKKKGKESDYYQFFNIQPEFSLMSRKPGIGRLYYDDHKEEIYEKGSIYLSTAKGGMKVKPPRYYDSLYDIEYPVEMEHIKKMRREMSDNICNVKLQKTDKNLLGLLHAEEEHKKRQVQLLRRDAV